MRLSWLMRWTHGRCFVAKALVVVAGLIASAPPIPAAAFDSKPSRPNIVFILADDLGWGDLHCYGHPYARTPNLDRLASEGTRFQQFYSTGVTCCPARTGLMTSRWPASYHHYPADGGFGERTTITDLLKRQGYATGHFGKWHIGQEQSPGTYGIDAISGGIASRRDKKEKTDRGRDAPIFDAAIEFIEQHRQEPFYVNVWGHISHFAVDPPRSYVDKFADVQVKESDFSDRMQEKFAIVKQSGDSLDPHLRAYLADVFSLDEDVGRLLRRLDELGLRENTIVVFSSDQGAAPVQNTSEKKNKNVERSKLRLNMLGYNGGLRGGKHTMYEGGVRIPLLVRWPGHVPAGRVDEKSVTSGIDWLPTLCAIAGVKIDPADFEGQDVSSAWLGGTFVRTRPLLWKTSNPRSQLAIRDGQWKLHDPNRNRGEIELYDISSDPGERNNLAAARPEIVRALQGKLKQWNATLPTDYLKADEKDD